VSTTAQSLDGALVDVTNVSWIEVARRSMRDGPVRKGVLTDAFAKREYLANEVIVWGELVLKQNPVGDEWGEVSGSGESARWCGARYICESDAEQPGFARDHRWRVRDAARLVIRDPA